MLFQILGIPQCSFNLDAISTVHILLRPVYKRHFQTIPHHGTESQNFLWILSTLQSSFLYLPVEMTSLNNDTISSVIWPSLHTHHDKRADQRAENKHSRGNKWLVRKEIFFSWLFWCGWVWHLELSFAASEISFYDTTQWIAIYENWGVTKVTHWLHFLWLIEVVGGYIVWPNPETACNPPRKQLQKVIKRITECLRWRVEKSASAV